MDPPPPLVTCFDPTAAPLVHCWSGASCRHLQHGYCKFWHPRSQRDAASVRRRAIEVLHCDGDAERWEDHSDDRLQAPPGLSQAIGRDHNIDIEALLTERFSKLLEEHKRSVDTRLDGLQNNLQAQRHDIEAAIWQLHGHTAAWAPSTTSTTKQIKPGTSSTTSNARPLHGQRCCLGLVFLLTAALLLLYGSLDGLWTTPLASRDGWHIRNLERVTPLALREGDILAGDPISIDTQEGGCDINAPAAASETAAHDSGYHDAADPVTADAGDKTLPEADEIKGTLRNREVRNRADHGKPLQQPQATTPYQPCLAKP